MPSAPPGGGTFSINQTTGAITVTPAPSTSLATTVVRVTCQDTCGAAVVKFFTLTVTSDAFVAPNFTSGAPPRLLW